MTEIKGTGALRPKTEVIGDWATVVAGKKATVITEITGSDGKPTTLQSIDPQNGTRQPLGVTAPDGWSTATHGSTSVVAGDTSDGNKRAPFIRISTDLRSWKEVKFSYPGKGWAFSSVALDGDVPLVIASDAQGRQALFRVEGRAADPVTLPAAKGQEIEIVDLVPHRDRLVLLHTEAARGDESVTRVMTSTDGGRSWERGDPLPGACGGFGLAGAVSTGSHLIATGWADHEPPLGTSGMVWTSTDGKKWKRERTTRVSWSTDQGIGDTEDFHLTAPTLIDGQAAFDQTCGTCTWTTRFHTDGKGRSTVKDNQKKIHQAEPHSDQLPRHAGVRLERDSLVVHEGEKTRTLVKGEAPKTLQTIERLDDTTYVSVGSRRFSGDPMGDWNETTHITPFVLDDALQRKDWQPKALGTWSNLSTATDEKSGTAVAVGTKYTDDGFMADSRAVSGGQWDKAGGLGRHGHESVGDVKSLGDRFFMSLSVAEDGLDGSTKQGRVYSSTDGSHWQEESGTWSTTSDTGSTLADICQLADGTALAAGSSQEDPNATYDATAWIRKGGTWHLGRPEVKGKGPAFTSCATTDGTTVVSGSVGGDDMEWTTTDGKKFTPGERLDRGVSRGTPEEVKEGLVASGYLDTEKHVGPVIWFSEDGKSWQWAPVEVDSNSASVSILTAEDEVYAVTRQSSGDRVWTIDEIATKKVTGDEG